MRTTAHLFSLSWLVFSIVGTVLAAPPEPGISLGEDGLFEIRWSEPSDGNFYELKASSDLVGPVWSDLPTAPTTENGMVSLKVPYPAVSTQSGTGRQFFRLEQAEPPSMSLPTNPGLHRVVLMDEPDPDGGAERRRSIYVFVPDSYSPPARDAMGRWPCPGGHPLAIILHGSGQTAQDFVNLHPDLITECNAKGIILIVPQAELNPISGKYGWNSAHHPAQRNDLRFLVLLRIVALAGLYVDPDQVHIGGFSNGGVMSMVASHSLPRLFASTAAIGSSIRSENVAQSNVSEVPEAIARLPILFVNARNDAERPFNGGMASGGTVQASFAEGQAFLRSQHCPTGVLTSSTFPIGGPMINTKMVWCEAIEDYRCPSEYEVETIALEGGGHIWPDAADGTGYDANDAVTDFFLRHKIQPVEDYGKMVPIPQTAGGTRSPLPSSGIDIAIDVPVGSANVRGLAVLFHGPGATHDSFVDAVEMTAMVEDLRAEKIGWVAFSASHPSGLWDLQNGPTGNNDVLKLLRVRQELINLNQISAATPIIPIGFDQGAHFAMLAAHLLHGMGLPVGGCGLLCPDFSLILPTAAQNAKANTLVPMWIFAQENDQVADATIAWNFHETLRYRSQELRAYSVMDLGLEKCPDPDRFDRILPAVDGGAILDYLEAEGLIDANHERMVCKRDLGETLSSLDPPLHLGYTLEQLTEVFLQIQVMFSAHHPEAEGHRLLDYLDGMIGVSGSPNVPWVSLDVPPSTWIDIPNFGGGG